MKKILALVMFTALSACSTKNTDSNSHKNAPQPSVPQQQQPFIMKGTVVKLFMKLVLPQAQALGNPVPDSVRFQGSIGDLPSDMNGQTCSADRCAVLVDTGVRDSSSQAASSEASVIAITPVINGSFQFNLSQGSLPAQVAANTPAQSLPSESQYQGHIFKIIVRNWDQNLQQPAASASSDREYTVSSADLRSGVQSNILITPESTLAARHRVESLQSDMNSSDSSMFVQIITKLYQVGEESVRDASLRLIAMLSDSSQDSTALQTDLASDSATIDFKNITVDQNTTPVGGSEDVSLVIAMLDRINASIVTDSNLRHSYFVSQNLQASFDSANAYYTLAAQYKYSAAADMMADPESDGYQAEIAATAALKAQLMDQASSVSALCPKIDRYIRISNAVINLDLLKVSASFGPYSSNADVQAKAGIGSSASIAANFSPEIAIGGNASESQSKAFNACCVANSDDVTSNSCTVIPEAPPAPVENPAT